jgi:hypothetical protein
MTYNESAWEGMTPMPARVVVVHDEPDFIERTVAALRAAGHEVMAFSSSMSAIDA